MKLRLLLFLAGWIAAASLADAVALPLPGKKDRQYQVSKKEAWEGCLRLLKGLPLAESDFDKGKIATEWITREENTKHFLFLGSVADLRCRYFIEVEGDQNRSHVAIWSRQEIQKYAGMQGLRRVYRESDGKGEREFLLQLDRELKKETDKTE